ncbi:MAG: hypothetical protein J3K34DRAFT_417709 [Monoraphidium minutum]|nr:MAG: hypothetical protein J3K34DRAFT_417709 [Monoraphidium minutum]
MVRAAGLPGSAASGGSLGRVGSRQQAAAAPSQRARGSAAEASESGGRGAAAQRLWACALALAAAASTVVLAVLGQLGSSSGLRGSGPAAPPGTGGRWSEGSGRVCLAWAACLAASAAAAACFHCVMAALPATLSLGEGALLTQGLVLSLAGAACALPEARAFTASVSRQAAEWMRIHGASTRVLPSLEAAPSLGMPGQEQAEGLLGPFVALLVASVCVACVGVWAAASGARCVPLGAPRGAARAAAVLVLVAPPAAVLGLLAAWVLAVFLPAAPHRVWVLAYWAAVLAGTLPGMRAAAARRVVPQIILRKGYHLVAAALFLPAFFLDLPLLCASLAIAFAALAAAEVARCTRLPLAGAAVQAFMQDFVDERDAGPLYVTHFTLLLGLACPMWLAAALACPLPGAAPAYGPLAARGPGRGGSSSSGAGARQWELGGGCAGALPAVLAGLSGMMVIGFGDTMASIVGSAWGRVPIHGGSRKTVEGTLAGAFATMGAWWAVLLAAAATAGAGTGAVRWPCPTQWQQLAVATVGACLLEACTSQLDNILIPLWYFPHCLLVTQPA